MDENLNEISGENVDTTATTADDVGENTSDNVTQNAESETVELVKEFTKEDVKKIMQKRINRSHQSFYNRYGVKDLDELDSKFALVDQLTKEKEELASQNNELLNKLAFVENDINPERIEDILAYFKGKDLVFNDENLKAELATHPEWKNIKVVDKTPTTTIKEMSPTRSIKTEDEESDVAKLFGLQKLYHF